MNNNQYYWYEDLTYRRVIIGCKHGREYIFNTDSFVKEYMKTGRHLTPEEAYKRCVIESQYVDFEEVKTAKLSTLTEKTL